jgi:cold shock protein
MKGTVVWFNNTKGYGFIGRDDGPDVFCHYTAIAGDGFRTLGEGDNVEFEIVQGPKGPQAGSVVKLPKAAARPENEMASAGMGCPIKGPNANTARLS